MSLKKNQLKIHVCSTLIQSQSVQQAQQAAVCQSSAELTQRRKDHQKSPVQKVQEESLLSVAAVLLVPSTPAPVTDIMAKNIGLQDRKHFSHNGATSLISPKPRNLRPKLNLPNLFQEFHHHRNNHLQLYRIMKRRTFTSGYPNDSARSKYCSFTTSLHSLTVGRQVITSSIVLQKKQLVILAAYITCAAEHFTISYYKETPSTLYTFVHHCCMSRTNQLNDIFVLIFTTVQTKRFGSPSMSRTTLKLYMVEISSVQLIIHTAQTRKRTLLTR